MTVHVLLVDGTVRELPYGSPTMGLRIREVRITNAADLTGWLCSSVLTRMEPEVHGVMFKFTEKQDVKKPRFKPELVT